MLTPEEKIIRIKSILNDMDCIADSHEFGLSYGELFKCLEEIRETVNK